MNNNYGDVGVTIFLVFFGAIFIFILSPFLMEKSNSDFDNQIKNNCETGIGGKFYNGNGELLCLYKGDFLNGVQVVREKQRIDRENFRNNIELGEKK